MAEDPERTYIEGSGGGVPAILALLLMALVALGTFLFLHDRAPRSDRMTAAAHEVSEAPQTDQAKPTKVTDTASLD